LKQALLILSICIIAYVIKFDLEEGTLPLSDFYEEEACDREEEIHYVQTKVAVGDTINSIFATVTTEVPFPFIERLTVFYQMNAHLQNQPLVQGDTIKVPIKKYSKCKN